MFFLTYVCFPSALHLPKHMLGQRYAYEHAVYFMGMDTTSVSDDCLGVSPRIWESFQVVSLVRGCQSLVCATVFFTFLHLYINLDSSLTCEFLLFPVMKKITVFHLLRKRLHLSPPFSTAGFIFFHNVSPSSSPSFILCGVLFMLILFSFCRNAFCFSNSADFLGTIRGWSVSKNLGVILFI